MIAPDSNRSATARSITTRSPLTVEEVEFDDGDVGYATDGTPVDCVRFAELGLVGGRPDLIVSGINHGANLGDDITYSGTVAAALEGIVLGHPRGRPLPAVLRRRHGLRQRRASTSASPPPSPPQLVAAADDRADARGDPDQRQLPGRRADRDRGDEARQTDLQRRAEAASTRPRTAAAATRSTAGSPATRRSRGPTSTRSPQGRIAVTPIHFDLTDHGGLERAARLGLRGDAGGRAARTGGVSAADAEQRAAELRAELDAPQPPLLRPRRTRGRRRRLRRAARRAARDRGRAPRAAHARLADPAGRGAAAGALRAGRAPRADALARQRPQRGGAARLGDAARATT